MLSTLIRTWWSTWVVKEVEERRERSSELDELFLANLRLVWWLK